MKFWLLLALPLLALSCKGKEENTDESGTFPVLSFIKSQVRDVDTSLYAINKIVTFEGRSDTTPLHRSQFREEAAPFLALPDITTRKWRDDYTETKLYDETLKRVVLFYTAKDPEAPIQREQVLIDPDKGAGGEVSTIIVDLYEEKNGGSSHKNLMWDVNQQFQITESLPGPGGTERIRHTRVVWNDFSRQ
ncbi:hypothetical protein EPD60_09730 [Flaviaesturariibacter flavus]|uniref:Lipoprotein n=1 Tax=Flaviaesturariibacter flavus TaxID=2502780 RepID=A0A4R1BBA0_9BACT|nr:hypothetical protein [Flaviaesturariibacter flavus]TCJ14271.1 hypothetical protein EPD60_09730 [Flaviaesturariibacter flavus]